MNLVRRAMLRLRAGASRDQATAVARQVVSNALPARRAAWVDPARTLRVE